MKKLLVAVLALTLVVCGTVAGTLAWLTAQSQPVVNTFTTTGITITLAESTGDEYKMVPGHTINKDPVVTVESGSEACWLFVAINEYNVENYIEYAIADGWTRGTNDDVDVGITKEFIYRKVSAEDAKAGVSFQILKDNQVTVKPTVDAAAMTDAAANSPELTFTAIASQLYKNADTEFTAEEAWGILRQGG